MTVPLEAECDLDCEASLVLIHFIQLSLDRLQNLGLHLHGFLQRIHPITERVHSLLKIVDPRR